MLADKLFEYTAEVKFEGADDAMLKGIVNFVVELKFLSVNAAIEIQRVADISMDFNIQKSMAILAEELRRIASGLNELIGKSVWQKPFTMPELASPSGSEARDCFFIYSISSYPLIENMKNVIEVCNLRKVDIDGDILFLREHKIPIINCFRHFNLPCKNFDPDKQTVIMISPKEKNYESGEGIYAVPIDDLDINAIFYSRIGNAVPPKKGHVFFDFARECWDVLGGNQVIFADWKKLISVIHIATDNLTTESNEAEKSAKYMPFIHLLSLRELEVIEAILAGNVRHKQLSTALNISVSTVKTHLIHIYQTTGVSSIASLLSLFHGYTSKPTQK
jgi:DNA-binding CsgD family transcriptional regulator